MNNDKYITKEYLKTYIQGKGLDNERSKQLVSDLSSKGYIIEGYNDKRADNKSMLSNIGNDLLQRGKNIISGIKEVGQAYKQEAENDVNQSKLAGAFGAAVKTLQQPLNIAGQIAGAGFDIFNNVVGELIPDEIKQAGEKEIQNFMQNTKVGKDLMKSMEAYDKFSKENPDLARAINNSVNLISINASVKGALKTGEKVLKTGESLASKFSNLAERGGEVVKNINVNKITEKLPIDAPENIKTSLNPFLTKTKADISVPTKKGYVLKKVADITEAEKDLVQKETANLYEKMIQSAEKFKIDRRDVSSPLEIVGKRTDEAMDKVNKIRKDAGKVMGEVEEKFKDKIVELKGSRLDNFVDEYLSRDKKFGRKIKDTAFLDDFVKDYDILFKNPNVKDTLEFVRTWTKELEDLKDGFGVFKENKRTYTLIEGAVSDIKNQTRNIISKSDDIYRGALDKYRLTSQLKDEANRLLGKEGLAGERLKGGAAAKRAVQSASDQGARQFYNVLKKITGYDGLKEADIALKAMKDVGDYQGLSLLEINKDLYQATINKVVSKLPLGESAVELTKAIVNKVVPQEKRVRNLIKR